MLLKSKLKLKWLDQVIEAVMGNEAVVLKSANHDPWGYVHLLGKRQNGLAGQLIS